MGPKTKKGFTLDQLKKYEYYEIEWLDWDWQEYMMKALGLKNVNSIYLLESGNDTSYTFDLRKTPDFYEDEKEVILQDAKDGGVDYSTAGYLLEALIQAEALPRGRYILNVCW